MKPTDTPTPRTDALEKAIDACAEYRKQLDEANAEVERLKQLCEWAETLLCNGETPKHSTPEEWSDLVKKWRDQFHNPDSK